MAPYFLRWWSRSSKVATLALLALVGAGANVGAAPPAETKIAIGEVTTAPAAGVDPAIMRNSAEDEIRQIDPAELPTHRKAVVSLALAPMAPVVPVVCTINATLRDAKTGTMIAIIEAGATAEGPGSIELRKRVVDAAVRNAVRRIPSALAAK